MRFTPWNWERVLGADAGGFFIPGACRIPCWPFQALESPLHSPKCSAKSCRERTWIIFSFPRSWFGFTSSCPVVCNLALPCWEFQILRREGAGCGKSLPWGG